MKKLPRIRSAFALFLFAASAPAAAHAQSGDDARRSQVIVSGTDIKITVGDVEDAIAQQSPFMRVRYRDPAKLAELVESMVNASLFAREATARGYDKDPDVVRNTKQTAVQTMIRKTIDDALTPESIPEPEVKAYYDAHSNEFHRPGLVRVSHILVPTKARAMEILAEAKKGDANKFRDLAQKFSTDTETKLRGGDLHYFDPRGIPMRLLTRFSKSPDDIPVSDRIDAALVKAAFALKATGDLSKPVAVGDQWSILRKTGQIDPQERPLDVAAPTIRQKLWRDKRREALDALVEKLRAELKPELHEDRLAPLRFEAPKAPAVPADPHGGHGGTGGAAAHAPGPTETHGAAEHAGH